MISGTTGYNANPRYYVFQRTNGVWAQQAELVIDEAWLGIPTTEMAINGDIAVLAHNQPTPTATGYISGATYIFKRTGATWRREAKILGQIKPTADVSELTKVSVSGNTLAIADSTGTGNIKILVRNVSSTGAASWVQQANLKGTNLNARLGYYMDLDGDTLVAFGEEVNGHSHVFQRVNGIWSKQASLKPAAPLSSSFLLAGTVAVQGNTILVQPVGTGLSTTTSRPIFVFQRSGATWSQQALLQDKDASELFGSAIWGMSQGLDIDGDIAVISDQVNGFGGGGKYGKQGAFDVFKRTGTTWSRLARVTSQNNDLYGYGVSISGNTILTGRFSTVSWASSQVEVFQVTAP